MVTGNIGNSNVALSGHRICKSALGAVPQLSEKLADARARALCVRWRFEINFRRGAKNMREPIKLGYILAFNFDRKSGHIFDGFRSKM